MKPKRKLKRHPWWKWFRQDKFTLVKGTHFDGLTHAMAQQVRNVAHRLGLKVSINIPDENTVEVVVSSPGER